MFVTANIEESYGSIVQIVNILFPAVISNSYLNMIMKVVGTSNAYFLDRDIIKQGFIENGDFPEWADTPICEVSKYSAKLLYAYYNLIINKDGDYHSTLPLIF